MSISWYLYISILVVIKAISEELSVPSYCAFIHTLGQSWHA